MILDIQLERDRKGLPKAQPSDYKPTDREKARIQAVLKDFQTGREIQQKPYREFEDMSLIDRQSLDQSSFNGYSVSASTDPDEAWRSNAVRPIVRNRVISIAAHTTARIIYPNFFAQNESDKDDKEAAMIMRELHEWAADQAGYEKTFLYAVIAALVNPAAIIYTEFAEYFRDIKEKNEKGVITKKRVLDDVFSGFKDIIVPVDELLIGNIREHDIQKQPFLIWRRAIDYATAKVKYGDKPNFKYVKPGIQTIFDDANDGFYEAYDASLQDRLVEEVIEWRRDEDIRVAMVNGVLMDDPDEPNPRKDKRYPFAKTGYELFDEGKFFYYSSLAKKLSKDEKIVNTLYRMIIDGSYLQLMPPMAHYGPEEVQSDVLVPGRTTSFSEVSRLEPISLGSNLNAGMAALDKAEMSVTESSNDVLQAGISPKGDQTAYETSRLEANAQVLLGMFAKMIGFLVKELGELRTSDIVQYMTVGELKELLGNGEGSQMAYKSFLMPEKIINGKSKIRKIAFKGDLPNEITDTDYLDKSFDILDEEGGLKSDKEICYVNPKIFRELKFKVLVRPDVVTPMSDSLKKTLNLELFDRAINLPFANQEALYKDLLLGSYESTRDDVDKYMKEEQPQMTQGQPMQQMPPEGGAQLSQLLGMQGKPKIGNESFAGFPAQRS